jgi:hypothetical protein
MIKPTPAVVMATPPTARSTIPLRSWYLFLRRRANGLAGLLAGGGRSQTADERVAEQRIQNWREEVPIGEPADGVTPV